LPFCPKRILEGFELIGRRSVLERSNVETERVTIWEALACPSPLPHQEHLPGALDRAVKLALIMGREASVFAR